MDEWQVLRAYLTSLGIGLLIGLERERAGVDTGGLRTFALITLLATTAGWLAQLTGFVWLPGIVLFALVALIFVAQLRAAQDPEQHGGTTTGVAMLLSFLLGWLPITGHSGIAVMLALLMTLLLYFKTELHTLTRKLSRSELVSCLQTAVVAFIVLPLLPDRELGPFAAINPYHVGMLVLLIAALNLAAYAALKLLPDHHALLAAGLVGGAVSSTAATFAYARQLRAGRLPAPACALVVQLANLMSLVRVLLLFAAAGVMLLPQLLPVVAGGLLAGLVMPLRNWLALRGQALDVQPDVRNPADLRAALSFAALFSGLLLLTGLAHQQLGSSGLYGIALLSGLVNVDALSLSALEMHGSGAITASTVLVAVLIALIGNMVFKLAALAAIGGRAVLGAPAAGYALTTAGLVGGYLLS